MFKFRLSPEAQAFLDKRTEAVKAAYYMDNLSLARKMLRLAEIVVDSGHRSFQKGNPYWHYNNACLFFVVPDMARRLGLPEDQIPERFRPLREDDPRGMHRIPLTEYHAAVSIYVENTPRWPDRNIHCDAALAWEVLTDPPENGSLMTIALERIQPATDLDQDWVARRMREIMARRHGFVFYTWMPQDMVPPSSDLLPLRTVTTRAQ